MAKVFGEWTKHILMIVMDDVNICGESWEEGDVWIEKRHKHILKDNMAKKLESGPNMFSRFSWMMLTFVVNHGRNIR